MALLSHGHCHQQYKSWVIAVYFRSTSQIERLRNTHATLEIYFSDAEAVQYTSSSDYTVYIHNTLVHINFFYDVLFHHLRLKVITKEIYL